MRALGLPPRVTQLLPEHQPERLAIIWSQPPHGFDKAIVNRVFRCQRGSFGITPDHQSVSKSPPANGAAMVLREGPPGDSVEPQAVFRRRRNFVDSPPCGCKHVGDDIAGFVHLANSPNGIVVDGKVVSLVQQSEPKLRLGSTGTVTAHRSLRIHSPHQSHGRQEQEPFRLQQTTPGPAVLSSCLNVHRDVGESTSFDLLRSSCPR
jgi:hypothetical protein